MFFSILSVMMIGVKNQKDPRDSIHHGGWMMKVICWCILVILMFFVPNEIISFYGKCHLSLLIFRLYVPDEVISGLIELNQQESILHLAESMSKFGAGFFLLVQVVLLLDFVHGWNDTWVSYDEQFWLVNIFAIICDFIIPLLF